MDAPKVFISYVDDDAVWVRRFAEALRAHDVDVWLDESELAPGDQVLDALEAALRDSDAIVSVLPADNSRQPSVFFELGVALGAGKLLIPIVPAEAEQTSIPYSIRARRYLTKGEPDDSAREVAAALKATAA